MKLCLFCNFQSNENLMTCPKDGSSLVLIGDDPIIGLVLDGRYKVESLIGQGAAGSVYKGYQEVIGREVAIKILHDYLVSDDEFNRRFIQEAKASSRLSHPNIITIYDFGVIPKVNRPYIVMDYLQGTALADLIIDQKRLSYKMALPIFVGVAQALGEAHRHNIVHRDIKPENIVLVERGEDPLFPILVDFGIARIAQEETESNRITKTGTVCGSPTYMSPEQCVNSRVGPSSDIYSLGIVIFEALTGEVPFLSEQVVKVMSMHLSNPAPKLNQMGLDVKFPPQLEAIIDKMLAKDPNSRYKNMDEVAEALIEVINLKDNDMSLAQSISAKTKIIQPTGSQASPPHNFFNKEINVKPEEITKHLTNSSANASYSSLPGWDTMIAPLDKPSDANEPHQGQFNSLNNNQIADNSAESNDVETSQTDADGIVPPENNNQLSAKDLALKRLEELSKVSEQQPFAENKELPKYTNLKSFNPNDFKKKKVVPLSNDNNQVGKFKLIILGLFSLMLITGVIYYSINFLNSQNLPISYDTQINNLLSQGKLDDCCVYMEQLNSQGKLNIKQINQLYSLYITLAKKLARQNKYEDALETLDSIPKEASQYKIAQTLKVKYLNLLENTDVTPVKPNKRKSK